MADRENKWYVVKQLGFSIFTRHNTGLLLGTVLADNKGEDCSTEIFTSKHIKPNLQTRKPGENKKMDANARNFEAELEAQHVEEAPEAARIHTDAEVATVTAL